MLADLGAKINMRKRTIRMDPDVMEDVSTEGGNEGNGVCFKIGDTGDKMEEITLDKFFLGDPKFLAMVINDCVLVGVLVNNKGAGRGMEKIGEEVGYRRLWE